MKLHVFLFTALLISTSTAMLAQEKRKALFLGNSYTGYNNLPQLVKDVALSAGDTLVYDSHTPGGRRLIDHSNDATSQSKIAAGDWDYVVMQGQSQEPIIALGGFRNGANALYNQIRQHNPCSVIMPYMTWGRENGDANNCPSWPVMCTYLGMDSTLRERYLDLTDFMNGEVSPVSVVWRYLRQNHPNIDLYTSDGSHPSTAGSYAAACCFYTAIFKKDPTLATFNFSLNTADAATIRSAAKTVVYDSLSRWDFKQKPKANFNYTIGSGTNQVIFSPFNPTGVRQEYSWDFGDNNTSISANPVHSYATDGTYTVTLTATNCDLQGTYTSVTDTVIEFCAHTPTVTSPNPDLCQSDTLWTQPADAYQWFVYGTPIPETNQYLTNYQRYGISGFSVLSTVNGCSELSTVFNKTPKWLGYYFDALGDPCAGDTVNFVVLHIDGSLPGTETILWFKDGVLQSNFTNQDTLPIFNGGTYECKVVSPNSSCPQDTTYSTVEYNCNPLGITENLIKNQRSVWNLFPNPTTESIGFAFNEDREANYIFIFNALGTLVKQQAITENKLISVFDLAPGIYFVRSNNEDLPTLRFVKQ